MTRFTQIYAAGLLSIVCFLVSNTLSAPVLAQTQNINVNTEVSNALGITTTNAGIGNTVAVPENGGTPGSVTINGAGNVSENNAGGANDGRVLDFDASVTPASTALSGGVPNATIQVTLPTAGITPPTDGTSSFTISNFTFNETTGGTTDNNLPLDTPTSITLNGTGEITLNFGFDLGTNAGQPYDDGTYIGSFDVEFRY